MKGLPERERSMRIYKNDKVKRQILDSYDVLLSEWGIDVLQTDVKGRYGTTHVIEFGDVNKKPLVLFHGVGDDSALMWIYNAKALSEHFHVFAVDTIGGPGKSIPGEGYNKNFQDVLWLDELLDSLWLKEVYMLGVSNGGYLTQMYAIMRPNRVRKGISMAGSIPITTGKSAMSTMMKIFLPEALLPTDQNVIRLIKKMTGDNYSAFTDNDEIFSHFKLLMVGFRRNAMLYHKVQSFERDDIDAIRDKFLYIAGRKDPFMNLGGGALLEQYHMNTLWIDNAGHGINHERPDIVNQAIINYLEKNNE